MDDLDYIEHVWGLSKKYNMSDEDTISLRKVLITCYGALGLIERLGLTEDLFKDVKEVIMEGNKNG